MEDGVVSMMLVYYMHVFQGGVLVNVESRGQTTGFMAMLQVSSGYQDHRPTAHFSNTSSNGVPKNFEQYDRPGVLDGKPVEGVVVVLSSNQLNIATFVHQMGYVINHQ